MIKTRGANAEWQTTAAPRRSVKVSVSYHDTVLLIAICYLLLLNTNHKSSTIYFLCITELFVINTVDYYFLL